MERKTETYNTVRTRFSPNNPKPKKSAWRNFFELNGRDEHGEPKHFNSG